MTWERIASAAVAALIGIVSWAFTAGGVWKTQADLPVTIATMQQEQKVRQDATDQQIQSLRQDVSTVKQDVARAEGKLDTAIKLLRGRE